MTRAITHGASYTQEYQAWASMLSRCRNPKDANYPNYGGRGITVCAKWETFEGFAEDMLPRPEGLTLDRKDNNGPYCKENCRWATRGEQQRNKRAWTVCGVKGVTFCSVRKRFIAVTSKFDGKRRMLYQGKDFFEAVCARKSWEERTYT